MSKLKKHGYVERLKYMHMLEEGYSRNYIHCKFGINTELLLKLWEGYKRYGESALTKQKNVLILSDFVCNFAMSVIALVI